ncbi:MAG: antibiotic biosynthesis monooxygenase [bacterium]
MISRVWRGWTTLKHASKYQTLLLSTILPGIKARKIPGYLGVRVDRRTDVKARETEFVTTMFFDDMAAVIAFAGPRYDVARVPLAARRMLSRYDAVPAHFEVIRAFEYTGI